MSSTEAAIGSETVHRLSHEEAKTASSELYDQVQAVLFANRTFLRQSAEIFWNNVNRTEVPNLWYNFTIPTETDEIYEVYLSTDRLVGIDHLRVDPKGGRSIVGSLEINPGDFGFTYFTVVPGGSDSQEALSEAKSFIASFKEKAR